MRIEVSGDRVVYTDSDGQERACDIGTPEAFGILSSVWLRSGWDNKYVYSFTWLGRPLIQLPEDVIRLQEIIYSLKPDLIIETGVAHGGGLVFYAGILEILGHGRVVGIDIDLREHNRVALDAHPLAHRIDIIEGSSIDPQVLSKVDVVASHSQRTLVILDSDHSRQHVLAELRSYRDFVTEGSYFVVCDGIMADLVGAPRSQSDWAENNPRAAIEDFLESDDDFEIDEPCFAFNEGSINARVTYWPNAYLKRVRLGTNHLPQ